MHDDHLLEWAPGTRLAVRTDDQNFTGEVFAVDKELCLLVLKTVGGDQQQSLHFLNAEAIREARVLEPPSSSFQSELPPLDLPALKSRADRAYEAAQARAARVGVGVSREGQRLFDALAKTMECRWSGTTIICMEEVIVKDPYREADVAPVGKEHHKACDRIRQIVREEAKRRA